MLLVGNAIVQADFALQCKMTLDSNQGIATLCIAAMRSLTALSAFLDVSSLNLAAPLGAAFSFQSRGARQPRAGFRINPRKRNSSAMHDLSDRRRNRSTP